MRLAFAFPPAIPPSPFMMSPLQFVSTATAMHELGQKISCEISWIAERRLLIASSSHRQPISGSTELHRMDETNRMASTCPGVRRVE
jgi:hypothetical protein